MLNESIALPDTVKLTAEYGEEYPVLVIDNPHCTGKVALHGGHLFQWAPKGEQPVIYTSPEAVYKEGKAIRGGIPLCWPWFNAHPTNPSFPSHGLARNRFWKLESVTETEAETIIQLSFSPDDTISKLWHHPFHTTVEIKLGREAHVSLTTHNLGSSPLTVGGALHTYLAVSDISQIKVSGLEGKAYIDTVGDEAVKKQDGDLIICEEVDRIYQDIENEITLHDEGWGRAISVTRSGSKSAVIWNPWVEKAKALSDLPDSAYTDFLCIEAANARQDVYSLNKGETHTLSTTLSTHSLPRG